MRVLLIHPADTHGPNYVVIPNVGLGFLATVLRNAGHEVEVVDCLRDRLSPDDLAAKLGRQSYDLIGLGLFSTQVNVAGPYLRRLRSLFPGALLVAGGPHPTFEPADTLSRFPDLDAAVVSEGEKTLVGLLERGITHERLDMDALRQIPNLAFRSGSQVEVNPVELIAEENLTDLPAWDLLRPDLYPLAPNGIFSRGKRVAPIIATRGCPYGCTFCGARKSMGPKVRKRPAQKILAEIEWLAADFGVDEIHFMDDNFSFDPDYVRQVSEGILASRRHIHWACPNGLRLDTLDEDLLRLMERSGCYSMAVGVESGSDRILQSIKKRLSIETVTEKIRMIKRATDIRLTGFFIVGLPQETEHDIRRTIRLACRLPLDRANFFNYSPFPGSQIYEDLKAAGELEGIDPGSLYIHHVVYAPPHMSRKKLARLQRNAHLKFYLRPHILWGLVSEIKSWSQLKMVVKRALKLLTG